MYNYKIVNSKYLEDEIDHLDSFPLQKNGIKEKIFERILDDAKENCEFISPEQLFDSREYGVWFHTVNYPEFSGGIARYDTFIIYRCVIEDNRRDINVILK